MVKTEMNDNLKPIEIYIKRFGYHLYHFNGNNLVRNNKSLLKAPSNIAVNVIAIHKSKKNLITLR